MFLTLGGLLGPDELTQVRRELAQLTWRDGAQTAGRVARAVKKNRQADLSSKAGAALRV
jgi:PKHD-type hydroxylase